MFVEYLGGLRLQQVDLRRVATIVILGLVLQPAQGETRSSDAAVLSKIALQTTHGTISQDESLSDTTFALHGRGLAFSDVIWSGLATEPGPGCLPSVAILQIQDVSNSPGGYGVCLLESVGFDSIETTPPSRRSSSVDSRADALDPPPGKPSSPSKEASSQRVQWGALFEHDLLFLGVMHSFRIATEPGTREALENHVWGGYLQDLGALHGWSDGDTYYETYLGHPIQGAVSGYMWVHHDPKYRVVEFGKSRDYWMSRLRAYAWSFAEQEQFKVGLLSEATIGQVSRYCCAYGFNDHIITSNGGIVWIVGGDALDRFVVRKIEDHTTSVPLRVIARVGLNPPLSMANLMDLNYPWHRENRAGVRKYQGDLYFRPSTPIRPTNNFVPRFELTAAIPSAIRFSNVSCLGGDGIAGYRVTKFVQWSLQVGGCMLVGFPRGWSGDSLTFMTGPQWILHSQSRWTPHAHLRAGGQKLTEEYCLEYGTQPETLAPGRVCKSDPSGYAAHYELTGAALSTGAGLDLRVCNAFNVRLADFDYVHTWVPRLNRTDFSEGYRFSVGVGIRVGTW